MMNQIRILCLIVAAMLCCSCRSASQLAYTDTKRVEALREAYRRISIGMSKPQIIAIVGEPDLILTPKSHSLNMRIDVWRYRVTHIDKVDGKTYETDVLVLSFPYWESQSPQAPLVRKDLYCPPEFLHEKDDHFWETGHTTTFNNRLPAPFLTLFTTSCSAGGPKDLEEPRGPKAEKGGANTGNSGCGC